MIKERKNTPEVLAPVGSEETLYAAVRSGADAVYLGSHLFSARRNAKNFGDRELKTAVEYCRKFGVRVYLTHNIMLKQSELADAVRLAGYADEIGIDGLIVQDPGLAALVHRAFPDMELHASTQMSIHSPSALAALKEMGFCRVVTAREMSKKQLEEFCREAERLDMSVEVFVHGALCMSVSGQCLLSSMLGGRSGNRGLCAGPCRLPFAAENGTGHDLSLKDLSLLSHINELKEMGVDSLKIEGRMKRPEYVAAATAACRSAVDYGFVPQELSDALQGVFSRSGFTDAYFTDKRDRNMFGIRTKEDVDRAAETVKKLHELYRNERSSVDVNIKCVLEKDKPSYICINDGVNRAEAFGDIVSAAQKHAAEKEDVIRAVEKLGGTPYRPVNTEVVLGENVFVSNSSLNSLRRDAVMRLDEMRTRFKARRSCKYNIRKTDTAHNTVPELIVRLPSAELLPENADGLSFMLPSEAEFTDRAVSFNTIVQAPRFIENEKQFEKRMRELFCRGLRRAFCDNLSSFMSAKRIGFDVIGGMGLNVCNSECAAVLCDLGISAVTLTPEMPLAEAAGLAVPCKKGVFAYGRLPLMLLRSCPLKNGRTCDKCDKNGFLTDRKGIRFPVRCCGGAAELLNSAPHYIADRLEQTVGLDFLLLYFTDETPETVKNIILDYKNGGKPIGNYTRGAYFRETP